VRLLFEVICDPIASEQCFELHEISTERGGPGVIKDGCTSLTTERHKLGGHRGGFRGVDVLGCQSKRKGWSKVDSCGSKTRNAKTGGPRCEQRVQKCSKEIPRGYGMSSSTKTAVEAMQGFENCLIWVKTRNANSSRPERERRAWKCSKSMPSNCERVSSAKTPRRTEQAPEIWCSRSKARKCEFGGQKHEWRVQSCSKSIPIDCEKVSSAKTSAETKWVVKS